MSRQNRYPPHKEVNDACARLFVRQHGILHLSQALEIGMSKHSVQSRLSSRRWERLLPKTYRLAGVAGSFEQQLLAAALWSGGIASHESAAALWGLDGARRWRIEITVEGDRSLPPVDWITLHRTNRALEMDRTLRYGIPVTTIPRTMVELGASVARWRLQAALDHALREGLTTSGQLAAALARLVGGADAGPDVFADWWRTRIWSSRLRSVSWSAESSIAFVGACPIRCVSSGCLTTRARSPCSTLRGPLSSWG